jgi:hypothetical protein
LTRRWRTVRTARSSWSAPVLWRFGGGWWESGRGLPQSKTLRAARRPVPSPSLVVPPAAWRLAPKRVAQNPARAGGQLGLLLADELEPAALVGFDLGDVLNQAPKTQSRLLLPFLRFFAAIPLPPRSGLTSGLTTKCSALWTRDSPERGLYAASASVVPRRRQCPSPPQPSPLKRHECCAPNHPQSAGPIFMLCGAACGMKSDQKTGKREWTLMNADEGTERGIHAASALVVPSRRQCSSPHQHSTLKRHECRAPNHPQSALPLFIVCGATRRGMRSCCWRTSN